MNAFRQHLKMIVHQTAVFATILAVDGPRVVSNFEHVYIYANWGGWVQDLAFERRLRHCREQAKSVFVGWDKVEVFVVPIARWLFFYRLLPA